jgi:hypothetical protein
LLFAEKPYDKKRYRQQYCNKASLKTLSHADASVDAFV